jgi:hypothetical protein
MTGSLGLALNVSCGSSGDGGGGSTSSLDGGVPLVNSDGGFVPPDAGPAAQNGDEQCAGSDPNACELCCSRRHQNGANVLTQALADCICGAPIGKTGTCQSECANSDCSASNEAGAPAQGDPCDTCERANVLADGGGACGPPISNACGQSQDCIGLFACWGLCAK